eukprot:9055512-Alexandrium_andersonii.AAC.1
MGRSEPLLLLLLLLLLLQPVDVRRTRMPSSSSASTRLARRAWPGLSSTFVTSGPVQAVAVDRAGQR